MTSESNLNAVKSMLQSSHLFRSLDEDARSELLEAGRAVTFEPGARLIQEGTVGNYLYVLQEGLVSVTVQQDEKEVEVNKLGEGAVIGEVSLLTEQPRTATVEALETSQAIAFNAELIRDIIEKYPKVKSLLTRVLQHRAQDTIDKLNDGYSVS